MEKVTLVIVVTLLFALFSNWGTVTTSEGQFGVHIVHELLWVWQWHQNIFFCERINRSLSVSVLNGYCMTLDNKAVVGVCSHYHLTFKSSKYPPWDYVLKSIWLHLVPQKVVLKQRICHWNPHTFASKMIVDTWIISIAKLAVWRKQGMHSTDQCALSLRAHLGLHRYAWRWRYVTDSRRSQDTEAVYI